MRDAFADINSGCNGFYQYELAEALRVYFIKSMLDKNKSLIGNKLVNELFDLLKSLRDSLKTMMRRIVMLQNNIIFYILIYTFFIALFWLLRLRVKRNLFYYNQIPNIQKYQKSIFYIGDYNTELGKRYMKIHII